MPEVVTSKESTIEVENVDNLSQNSTDYSHGEDYKDVLYGSGVQASGIPDGFVCVHDNVFCAVYKPLQVPKSAPIYICLNKSSCKTKYGGHGHASLRSNPRTRDKPGTMRASMDIPASC